MKRIAAAGGAVVVMLVAAVLIYFNVIRSDAPDEFTLTDPSQQSEQSEDPEGSGEPQDGSSADEPEPGNDSGRGADPAEPTGLDGTWSVGAGSEAGYRVIEDLGSIQDFEAAGRTSDVTGSLEITGSTITAGAFEVEIAGITSDDDRRDGQFRGPIMNAANFPTATLTLTEPIELGSIPGPGTAISESAAGELTLRGVTNPVTFPVDAQVLGDRIEIVASIDVLFSDYGIDNPSNSLVSVRDEGKVEVRLLLSKG